MVVSLVGSSAGRARPQALSPSLLLLLDLFEHSGDLNPGYRQRQVVVLLQPHDPGVAAHRLGGGKTLWLQWLEGALGVLKVTSSSTDRKKGCAGAGSWHAGLAAGIRTSMATTGDRFRPL